jgi:hypothetical protein
VRRVGIDVGREDSRRHRAAQVAERVRSGANSALLLRVGFAVGGLDQQLDECVPFVLTEGRSPVSVYACPVTSLKSIRPS